MLNLTYSMALVLGGGGICGMAWEIGILSGLHDLGIDLTRTDLVVGTSAGAVIGTQVASGTNINSLFCEEVRESIRVPAMPSNADVTGLLQKFSSMTSTGPLSLDQRMKIGTAALSAKTESEESRLATIRDRLHVDEWPERKLRITAVDAQNGAEAIWDKNSGVELLKAVAASCAVPCVYPPITINGRRYVDGGIASGTHAELAQGSRFAVILAPHVRTTGQGLIVGQEIHRLEAAGTRTCLIVPDDRSLSEIGPNPMDSHLRAKAARAGNDQAAKAAAHLRAQLSFL